jgi:multiple antibiotic resistance protein
VFFKRADNVAEWFSVLAGIGVTLSITLFALRYSGLVVKLIGPAGVVLLARVAGMLLAAIAVQMIANSVIAFVQTS